MSDRSIRIGHLLLLLAIFIAVAELLRSSLALGSFERGILSIPTQDGKPELLGRWELIDPVIRNAFGHEGNIVAHFPTFSKVNPTHENLAGLIYFRTAYLMWPRRMFVANDQTIIRSGLDILSAQAPNDPKWLADHHVCAKVEFELQNGKLVAKTLPIGVPSR